MVQSKENLKVIVLHGYVSIMLNWYMYMYSFCFANFYMLQLEICCAIVGIFHSVLKMKIIYIL